MNRIKLFGKVEYVSDLKFDIALKLKVYMNIEIVSINSNSFKCVVYNKLCDKLRKIDIGEYIYAFGYVTHNLENECIFVIQDIEKVI